MLWSDKIHFLDMFRTCSKKVPGVENEVFPKSFGDLWAMCWHHPWCLRRGLKFETSLHFFKQIKCVPEAPESYLKSFGPRIKFIALFSCQFMHFLIFPKNYFFKCSPRFLFLTAFCHYNLI